MHYYSAYGLTINSHIRLPFLSFQNRLNDSANQEIDVNIQLENNRHFSADTYDQNWHFDITREKALLFIKDVATFVLHAGRDVLIYPENDESEPNIQSIILGSIFAMLLYQRNQLALHASSINVNGSAVAFMGTTGAGKSTIGCALIAKGHTLISDDVSPISFTAGCPYVSPGYPMMKIMPETASELGFPPKALMPIHTKEHKYFLSCESFFEMKTFPLKCLFILSTGNAPVINKMTLSEVFPEILRHTIPTMWGIPSDTIHFKQLSQLLEKTPVYRFVRNLCSGNILAQAEMIERFLQ